MLSIAIKSYYNFVHEQIYFQHVKTKQNNKTSKYVWLHDNMQSQNYDRMSVTRSVSVKHSTFLFLKPKVIISVTDIIMARGKM